MFDLVARRTVPLGWVLALSVFVYAVCVTFLRSTTGVALPHALPRPIDLPPGFYGTEPAITHFYAGTGVLTKGESAVLCYGVRNVRSVTLHPPVEELKPALNRCFSVTPEATTSYTLAAEAADGRTFSHSFEIVVHPAPPVFTMLATSGKDVTGGDRWTFCYSVENAVSVMLEPNMLSVPPGKKHCIMLFPTQDSSFRLIAKGEGGVKAVERMFVRVVGR